MIADELREWARDNTVQGEVLTTYPVQHPVHGTLESLLTIADRIDAEHQNALDEWKAEYGQMWLKGYSECHAELLEGNETLASDLEKCGWICLPLDVDGAPIYDGDKMVSPHGDVFIVTHMMLENGTWTVHGWKPSFLHHHKSPVEDVLEGFARAYDDIGGRPDEDELWRNLLAEYAAKLRLAGDDE